MAEMQFQNVCLEAVSCTLPEEVVDSGEIEARLAPLYKRLRLPEGRLELMTGIRQRRFWPPGMPPSRKSVETAEKAMEAAGLERAEIGALVHGSVCRDFLEPATACSVHHGLGLGRDCLVYDVSNACLGLLNGIVQVAAMIELGQIRAGVVVGTESGRNLVETTIARLNADTSLSRNDIKPAFASLTIGSASAAVVLCDRELSRTGNRLLGGAFRTNTDGCRLCQSEGLTEFMETDSEALMREGIAVARETFEQFLGSVGWNADGLNKTVCHQVGRTHHRLMFEALGLAPELDFSTFEWLGNTGAAALPATAALGMEAGHLRRGDRVGLLGIGSGINVVMLGVEWQRSPTASGRSLPGRHFGQVDAADRDCSSFV